MSRERIAKRVARFFQNGDLVNLGIGLPTLVANYLPEGLEIEFQSENGMIGLGSAPAPGEEDKDITNAGAQPATVAKGGSCFDSAMSFAVIRGGHVDATVLGALEVDQEGSLANWIVPGKLVPGMAAPWTWWLAPPWSSWPWSTVPRAAPPRFSKSVPCR